VDCLSQLAGIPSQAISGPLNLCSAITYDACDGASRCRRPWWAFPP
jgi:hypothetical protein